jgi:6-phosphogluconolactonase
MVKSKSLSQIVRSIALSFGVVLLAFGMSACGGSGGSTANTSNPLPSLISFSPVSAKVGGGNFELTLHGSNFVASSAVLWNGNARATTFVSSNQLTAEISANDIATPGIAQVTVSNSSPGGGTSQIFRFDIDSTIDVQRFLYVANSSENTISGYSIDRNSGSLSELPGSPFLSAPTATNAGWVIGDRFGRFLYVRNEATIGCKGCESVSVLDQDGKGALTPAAGSPIAGSAYPSVADPTGNIVYQPSGSDIATMLIDASTGSLIQLVDSPGLSAFPTAINAAGTLLYGPDLNGVWSGAISANTGAIVAVPGSPFGGMSTSAVAVDPSGSFAFAVHNDSQGGSTSALLEFSIDASTGALTLLSTTLYAFPVNLAGVLVHPSGRFLYASGQGNNTIQAFTFGTAGTLTPVAGSPFSTGPSGINPMNMVTDPDGRFLYVADFDAGVGGNISAFTVDTNTGALTLITGSPFPAGMGPMSMVISPR